MKKLAFFESWGSAGGEGPSIAKATSSRAVLSYGVMALLLVVAVVVLGDRVGRHFRAIDSWIASLGPWGVLAFIGLFIAATSLFFPETVLSIMAGALFGMAEGLPAVVAGGQAAATVQYLLSRWVLRSRIERTLAAKPPLAAIQHAVMRNELRLQVLIRMTPLNPATLNYLFGATGVRFRGFLLASLAFLPHQVVEVYFGYASRNVAKIAGRGGSAGYLHDATVLGGLVLCIFVVIFVARTARRAVAEAVAEAGEAPRGSV